jgi:hypothetical protein
MEMQMRGVLLLLGLMVLVAGTPASAQVNKWVDEKGRVQYGDKPPPGKSVKPTTVQKAPPGPPPKKSVPPQPKFHVPGDPLVQRMYDNEARRERERVTAQCWKQGVANCADSGIIDEILIEQRKAAAAAKKTEAKPIPREPLSPDFCKRNPRVEGCQPGKK